MLYNFMHIITLFLQINAIQLPFVEQAPIIDGIMDNNWNNTYIVDTTWMQLRPDFGKVFEDSAIVYMCYDNDNVYIFIKVFQDTNKLTQMNGIRDSWGDRDQVTIMIDPMGNKQELYYIDLGLPDVISDLRFNRISNNHDMSWNSHTEYSIKITNYGYNMEIAIPFSDFRRKNDHMVWNMNFVRETKYNQEQGSLFPYKELTENENFEAMRSFEFQNIKTKREKIEIMPYGFYGKNIDSTATTDVGFDIRYPITSSSVMNFAFNPDFSQLEGDPLSIDFNSRYAIYYREYRPFFTEEKGIFDSESEIFYSRAIQNPYIAGKYIYKDENNIFGAIIANDEYDSLIGNSNTVNNIFRYMRQFNKNSVGLYILDNYNTDNDTNNLIIEHDANLYITNYLNLSYTWALSAIMNNNLSIDSIDYDNYFLKTSLSYIIQDFSINYTIEGISPDYSNALGYTSENNKIKNEFYISKSFRFSNSIINILELSQSFNVFENWDNIENISYNEDSLSHTEYNVFTKLFIMLNKNIYWGIFNTFDRIYYYNTFLSTNSQFSFFNIRFNKYITLNTFVKYGGSFDYNYVRVGKTKYANIGIELHPFSYLSIENKIGYSIFETDTSQQITDYNDLGNNLNKIWDILTFNSSMTITPNNTFSIKFIFEETNINFAENYYSSLYYINNIDGDINDIQYKVFSILEYKPSLDNTVYFGARYDYANTTQLRNLSKNKIIFFKFTHKFYI